MTELNTRKTVVSISSMPQAKVEATRRLIVIVPPEEVDVTMLTQRVWEAAQATGAQVKLLSLCDDTTQEPSQRRRLATMSAMINSGQVRAEAEILPGKDWLEVVRSRLQAGDMLVCCSGPEGGSMRRELRQIMESNLNVPVTILSGCTPEEKVPARWGTQILGWAGSVGILAGFFWLQVKLGGMPRGPEYTLLLLLTIPVEIWLVWLWNSLFS